MEIDPCDMTLVLVQLLFRHGARSCNKAEVVMAIPDYVDYSFQTRYGFEQLTNVGKAQMYEFGCVLRNRYDDYLGKDYHPEDVYAYTSDTDRTKMSLQLVLAGLYPPSAAQTWHPTLKWQPIPYHCQPRTKDVLLQSFKKARYLKLIENKMRSAEGLKIVSKLLEMNEFFEKHNVHSLKKYYYLAGMGIYNVLYTHNANNATLPHWYSDEVLEKLKASVSAYFDIMASTPEMRKLVVGPLMKTFVANMRSNDTITPAKIYLYSGHDLNLAPFVRAHRITNFDVFHFGSSVIVEKHRDSKGREFVRLMGWDGDAGKLTSLRAKNFGEFIPMEDYVKLVEDCLPTDEEVESIENDADGNIVQPCLNIDFNSLLSSQL